MYTHTQLSALHYDIKWKITVHCYTHSLTAVYRQNTKQVNSLNFKIIALPVRTVCNKCKQKLGKAQSFCESNLTALQLHTGQKEWFHPRGFLETFYLKKAKQKSHGHKFRMTSSTSFFLFWCLKSKSFKDWICLFNKETSTLQSSKKKVTCNKTLYVVGQFRQHSNYFLTQCL